MHIERVTVRSDRFPPTDRYPFDQPAVRGTSTIEFPGPVCFFVGENGSGKTTVLEAIVRRCGIHVWCDRERPRLEANPQLEALQHYVEVHWRDGHVPGAYFSSSNFQHFAYTVDQWAAADRQVLQYYGGQSLLVQSHGQSVLAYLRARCQRPGLYFMDEPETALSPRSQVELVRLVQEAAASGRAQFVIATHSPILLACPGAVIYSFDRIPVERVDYEATPTVRMYRQFMLDPAGAIARAAT
jgi:predicted ATPase